MARVAGHLSAQGNSPKLMVKSGGFLDKRLTEQGLHCDYLNVMSHHFPLFAALKLARYIRREGIDIIHMHHGKDLFLCVLARVLAGRGRIVYTRQMALTRAKKDAYHRFLYRNVDRYLVITRTLKQQALQYLPLQSQKVSLLYYGVPDPDSDGSACKEYFAQHGFSAGRFSIAIFGRVEAVKGQHLVVEAVRQLTEQGHDLQAAIIGHVMNKEYFTDLEKTIERHGLTDKVRYAGFHNKPVSIMGCFDVVILATRCETFGLVLPEAMRCGCCVIGSDCGGVPEIIDHEKTGLLFRPDDATDLARQLEKLIQDPPLRQSIAAQGKQDADRRFSDQAHFEHLMRHFSELVD